MLYADDTAVATGSAAVAMKVLRNIELSAVHHRLKLNSAKCEAMVMGEDGASIRFDDGAGVAQPDVAKYLGRHICATQDVGKELGRRLGGAAHA